VRIDNEVVAMSQKERVKVQLKNFFSSGRAQEEDSNKDVEENIAPQYRLETSNRNRRGCLFCKGAVGVKELSDIKPNERLASSLHWMFRSNFLVLFAVMCLCFFAWILFFAGIIMGAGRLDNECVRVGKANAPFCGFIVFECFKLEKDVRSLLKLMSLSMLFHFVNLTGGETLAIYSDAFALSWTTFSTVSSKNGE
jgi:hypothetical protein